MVNWSDLTRELDMWAKEGRAATFWWRDDDAVEVTPALEKLFQIADEAETPLSLAVIPGILRPELVSYVNARTTTDVLQHGYMHVNHAPPGCKDSEFGEERNTEGCLEELALGFGLLEGFHNLLPVLVPPWNRIDGNLVENLPGIGFLGISTFTPRRAKNDHSGLMYVNTHVDIVDWTRQRRFLGKSGVLQQVLNHLTARRSKSADPAEPTGLLTHHLVHGESSWGFIRKFLKVTKAHRAVRWLGPKEAFGF
ncbi:MAG: polysaccharide deacetylase family protein [Rhodospirillales bacterium]